MTRGETPACKHGAAVALHTDNHGDIYTAAGCAAADDEARWCPGCGALRLKYQGWKSPAPAPASPRQEKGRG